jgi:hypothetical protein
MLLLSSCTSQLRHFATRRASISTHQCITHRMPRIVCYTTVWLSPCAMLARATQATALAALRDANPTSSLAEDWRGVSPACWPGIKLEEDGKLLEL